MSRFIDDSEIELDLPIPEPVKLPIRVYVAVFSGYEGIENIEFARTREKAEEICQAWNTDELNSTLEYWAEEPRDMFDDFTQNDRVTSKPPERLLFFENKNRVADDTNNIKRVWYTNPGEWTGYRIWEVEPR